MALTLTEGGSICLNSMLETRERSLMSQITESNNTMSWSRNFTWIYVWFQPYLKNSIN